MAKPSDFIVWPWSSVCGSHEHEQIAINILKILSRTGNEWRLLSWSEYAEERKKDTGFRESEAEYFADVQQYTVSESAARCFSLSWRSVGSEKEVQNEAAE